MWRDVRYAMRLLVRAPGFALVAVLTLALGIGANTAIFSVVRGMLLAPLPFADPDRLVAIWHGYPHAMPRTAVSAPGFFDLQESAAGEISSGVAAFSASSQNLTGGGEPDRLVVVRTSQSFQPTLGLRIALGRWFAPEEDVPGDSSVIVLSDGLWQRRFRWRPAHRRPDDSRQRSAASRRRHHGAVGGVSEARRCVGADCVHARAARACRTRQRVPRCRRAAAAGHDDPQVDSPRVDLAVLAFALVTSIASSLLFGLIPAWQLSRTDLRIALNEESRGGSGRRTGRLLVAGELAVAFSVLVGAGLLMRSFARVTAVDPGFGIDHRLTLRVSLPLARYRDGPQRAAFYAQLFERLTALPGVRAAGGVS